MRALKISFLVFILSISIYAQWSEAYYNIGGFWNLSFTDTLNGWFTHYGVDKIIHTSDGGHTFNVQQVTPGNYDMNDVYMVDSQNGWCSGGGISGGPGMIHRTTNGGATWLQITHPAPGSSFNGIGIFGNTVWFVGGTNSSTGIIMKTSDNGQNWEVTLYPNFEIIVGITIFDEQNYILNGINLLARTTDGGSTWTSMSLPPDMQVERVKFINSNIGYALVTHTDVPYDSYLYKTTDSGFTWNLHYTWPASGQRQGLSVIPGTNNIFVAGSVDLYYQGILKSTDGGVTWNTMLTDYRIYAIYTPSIYHGWAGAGAMIYRYDYVTPPVVEPIGNQHIQLGQSFTYQVNATGMGLKYSMTGQPSGLNIGLYSGLINGTPTVGGKFDITVVVNDTDANVVNTQFNLHVNRRPFFITNIEDSVFTQLNILYEQLLEAEDADDDTLYFTALTIPNFLSLTQGDSRSIYSALIGGTPTGADTGYHNIQIEVIDGFEGSDTISWILYVDNVTGVGDNQTVFEFKLNQNYPNPFNPNTKIKYTIPSVTLRQAQSDILVTLKVYDILGREVATLVNEEKPAGEYEVEFDGSNLPSGIYFYQIRAGSFAETKKMVLLK